MGQPLSSHSFDMVYKNHLTVILSTTGRSKKFSPTINFKVKIDKSKEKRCNILDAFKKKRDYIYCQEKLVGK